MKYIVNFSGGKDSKVNVMPTLLFVDKYGREVKRVIGFHTKEQIEEIFKELRWI